MNGKCFMKKQEEFIEMSSLIKEPAPFSLLEKAIVYSQGWQGERLPLPLAVIPPSSNPAAPEAVSSSQEKQYVILSLKDRQQDAGRKPRFAVPSKFSEEFWLGQSGPDSRWPGLLSTGDPLSKQEWRETDFCLL